MLYVNDNDKMITRQTNVCVCVVIIEQGLINKYINEILRGKR